MARAAGATKVTAVDGVPARLRLAARFGADATFDRGGAQDGLVAWSRERHPRGGADVVIETAGAPTALTEGIRALRPGGRLVTAGLVVPGATITLSEHHATPPSPVALSRRPAHAPAAIASSDRRRRGGAARAPTASPLDGNLSNPSTTACQSSARAASRARSRIRATVAGACAASTAAETNAPLPPRGTSTPESPAPEVRAGRRVVEGDDRESARHRLQDHVPEGLGLARKKEHVGGRVVCSQREARLRAAEHDVGVRPLEGLAQRSVSDDDQLPGVAGALHRAVGLDRERHVLLRRDAADVQRDEPVALGPPLRAKRGVATGRTAEPAIYAAAEQRQVLEARRAQAPHQVDARHQRPERAVVKRAKAGADPARQPPRAVVARVVGEVRVVAAPAAPSL
jgi:hypothetical protein